MTNSLTTPPVAPLLDRLFAEAAAADADVGARFGVMSPDERAALMADYKQLYAMAREKFLPVSRETGRLLYMLARSSRARSIVEFGTSFAISTVHLAAAVKDNGGGVVIGSEFEPTKAARARAHLAEAGLADLVDVREGDALESLAQGLPASLDLVLLDGAKPLYGQIFALLEPRLAPNALVVADNVEDSPAFLARIRASGDYVSVPFSSEVEVAMRL